MAEQRDKVIRYRVETMESDKQPRVCSWMVLVAWIHVAGALAAGWLWLDERLTPVEAIAGGLSGLVLAVGWWAGATLIALVAELVAAGR